MTEEEIKLVVIEQLKKIAPDAEPANLRLDDDIRHTLEIDSFDSLQFVVAIDDFFGIDIPEEDYGKITTLRNLINYIAKKKR